ncbi:tRNA epoxyqueuosine(34) reductase QueG [Shewanella sp. A32]|uniref:tRNA epoxyqueuosine(34) reductase QueG n=1 Tax=Shewanella sp. A32 TaxID=3031327 RepID=UPI0023BA1062|nr:tRNA epoxyqueuosine(34) reductase QueG [Shewanella sp. A32]MDF0534062.1 tRNA epoxyqueuosine(34) reductase QueG [Shewanella sp. A32]
MTTVNPPPNAQWLSQLARDIKAWGQALGFAQVGISDIDLTDEEPRLQQWLAQGCHGEMQYMAQHGMMRARPQELHPGTLRVISVRMDYLPPNAGFASNLSDPNLAYISRYAGGRDYHKVLRNRLKKLGEQIDEALKQAGLSDSGFRPFVDSAPLLERPLADNAGIGWTGKHSLLLNHDAGSWFFLGELLINLPLPVDIPLTDDCGNCVACITSCPTGAIVAPYTVDARRCISYLTIELSGAIPTQLRPLIGNRIYGCDDCQLVCPVNREAPLTQEADFHTRAALQQPTLLALFNWDEATFLKNTEGSAIRRIGYERWQRNLAVALGNAPASAEILQALQQRLGIANELLAEHIQWALEQQQLKLTESDTTIQRKTARLIRVIRKGLPRDA